MSDTETHDVAVCRRCGKDPVMYELRRGYVVDCPGHGKPVTMPRAGQAVKTWNKRQGVPVIRAPALLPNSSTVMAPAAVIAPPITVSWRQKLRARWDRLRLTFLWTLSRPGWRACKPCEGIFSTDRHVLVCAKCYLPYTNAEAELMTVARLRKEKEKRL